jgi:hypothetical protein
MVAVVVSIVSVEDPDPEIDEGLKPPLVMPIGKPPSLLTLKATLLVNPASGVMVTV